MFELLQWTLEGVNLHWRVLYGSGVWAHRDQAKVAVEAGLKSLDSHVKCSTCCNF